MLPQETDLHSFSPRPNFDRAQLDDLITAAEDGPDVVLDQIFLDGLSAGMTVNAAVKSASDALDLDQSEVRARLADEFTRRATMPGEDTQRWRELVETLQPPPPPPPSSSHFLRQRVQKALGKALPPAAGPAVESLSGIRCGSSL